MRQHNDHFVCRSWHTLGLGVLQCKWTRSHVSAEVAMQVDQINNMVAMAN